MTPGRADIEAHAPHDIYHNPADLERMIAETLPPSSAASTQAIQHLQCTWC